MSTAFVSIPSSPLSKSGFTLIEMSIVLVIIGLIIGGILTGRYLIEAAAIRAQISQIEKYNSAVNAFRSKYGYLPGDIPSPYATNFGFAARGTVAAEGDGNGIIQGACTGAGYNPGIWPAGMINGQGETALFWPDLTTAGLIDSSIAAGSPGSITLPNATAYPSGGIFPGTTPNINAWIPQAKIGGGAYVSLYSFGGKNYYQVTLVYGIACYVITDTRNITPGSGLGLTVQQAYNLDKKVDDGLPQTGSVTACYDAAGDSGTIFVWSGGSDGMSGAGNGLGGSGPTATGCTATTSATSYNANNCYDNNGVAGTETYSVSRNASAANCNLSFQFQ